MPVRLPPIPEEQFAAHGQDTFAQTAAAHAAQMDAAQQAQDASARAAFDQTAQANLGAIRSAQEQGDARRAFYDTAEQHRAAMAQPVAPAASQPEVNRTPT